MGKCGSDDTDLLWSGADLGWPVSGRKVADKAFQICHVPSSLPRKKKKKLYNNLGLPCQQLCCGYQSVSCNMHLLGYIFNNIPQQITAKALTFFLFLIIYTLFEHLCITLFYFQMERSPPPSLSLPPPTKTAFQSFHVIL